MSGSHHDKDQMDYVTKEHTDKVEERMIWPNVWSPFSSSLDLVEQTCLPCRMGCVKKKLKLDNYQADSEGLELAKSTSKSIKRVIYQYFIVFS